MKRAFLIGLALVCAFGFLALGVWQVERRAWKLDLIARVESRIHAAPAPIPEKSRWSSLDPTAEEYRRVTLSGTFLHDNATYVKAVTERGPGFWLITPMRTPQGVVMINRGFVPSFRRDAGDDWCGGPREQQVTGLIRVSEPGGGFLRANDPAAGRWYSRDVAAIAKAQRVGEVAPFFVDAEATPNPQVYPVGGLTVVAFRNNHLVYALTWFGLAGLSAFGAFMMWRGRPG